MIISPIGFPYEDESILPSLRQRFRSWCAFSRVDRLTSSTPSYGVPASTSNAAERRRLGCTGIPRCFPVPGSLWHSNRSYRGFFESCCHLLSLPCTKLGAEQKPLWTHMGKRLLPLIGFFHLAFLKSLFSQQQLSLFFLLNVSSRLRSTVAMSSNIHVLEMPKGFLGIRIAQLVIGLIELALIAFLMARTLGAVFSAEAWAILCCKFKLQSTLQKGGYKSGILGASTPRSESSGLRSRSQSFRRFVFSKR
jgi:hypothetical protein